jgi:4-hydroxy-4-methyl-2-oxoglutarate aldolase
MEHKEIVSIIEKNRISSTEIADALGKSGVLHGLMPINQSKHVTGKVKYIYAFDESNWSVHEQIRDLEEDLIVYVDSFNCDNKAIFGDLVSKYLILYKRVKGIVVNGLLRDVPNLRKHGYPIWCKGYSPLGCFNRPVKESPQLLDEIEKKKSAFENGIITCDDAGCVLIESHLVNENTYRNLDLIELQEDIWYFCIDTLKWNTYDTVCKKRYLTEPEVLPTILQERLKDITFKH